MFGVNVELYGNVTDFAFIFLASWQRACLLRLAAVPLPVSHRLKSHWDRWNQFSKINFNWIQRNNCRICAGLYPIDPWTMCTRPADQPARVTPPIINNLHLMWKNKSVKSPFVPRLCLVARQRDCIHVWAPWQIDSNYTKRQRARTKQNGRTDEWMEQNKNTHRVSCKNVCLSLRRLNYYITHRFRLCSATFEWERKHKNCMRKKRRSKTGFN